MTNLTHEIVSRIRNNCKAEQIILFGSYAAGTQRDDSDIDLVVVLDESGFSESYSQKIQKRLNISKLFYDIQAQIPMDILVYTRDEWKKLQEINSSFIREINLTGVQLLCEKPQKIG